METTEQTINLIDIADKLLQLYVSDDTDRENLMKPFMPISSHVTATTSYDGIWILVESVKPESVEIYKKNTSIDGFLKAVPFNPATGNPIQTNSSFVLHKEQIITALKNIPQIEDEDEVEVDCDSCSGTGEEECDMGHTHACSYCDGSKKMLEYKPNGKMIDDTSKYVLCNGMGIGVKRLRNLLEVMEITDKGSCVHILTSPNSCNFFNFVDFIVYCMPMMTEDDILVNVYHEIK